MEEGRTILEIREELRKISKELGGKAFNSRSVRITAHYYDASQYVDDAIRKIDEIIERVKIEGRKH